MKICDFTMPEIRHLLAECNFTKDEECAFLIMASGSTTEDMAEKMNISTSTAKRILKRIWSKVERIKGL